MKTISINLYKLNELSEEAKKHAISELYDINVDHDWWESTYEDAKNIGLKITGFGLDRSRHAEGELINSLNEVCDKIISDHGENCETYKAAIEYRKKWNELVKKYSDGVKIDTVTEDNEYDFDQDAKELEDEFLNDILEDYSIMLQKESEYLTSDEAIIAAIEANEYDFTEDGELN